VQVTGRPKPPAYVAVGRSDAADPRQAVVEAMAALPLAESRFLLAFLPASLPPDATLDALTDHAAGVPIFGCTTAGQITPLGYEEDALLVIAFPRENFRCASVLFSPLRPFSAEGVAELAQRRSEKFRSTAGWNRLGLIFADGLSKQEDLLVSSLDAVLGGIPIFGGSAGDGLRFEETRVLHDGRAHCNAAVLLLLETNLEFRGLGFDHFLPMGDPLVITEADPDERLVYEINGSPAALEYARLVGCPTDALSPQVFAENPLLVSHEGRHFVRAISDTKPGNALSFMAAIDDGLIMTLGRGQEIVETLEHGLEVRDNKGRAPDFVLGFDCVLRKLEAEQKQLARQVSDVLCQRRVVGFNTYGEQLAGAHVNQTFVGVAFFEPQPRALS
jgi:hypothetical protein